ncbi:MAG: HD domain-containing protein [Desulfobulbaceae bacterium]|nr:HD domain-containing protein [Desulfobulbaceae bacterium]
MSPLENSQYIIVRPSQVHYYAKIPLFHNPTGKEFILYKDHGARLSPQRMISSRYPQLYLHNRDRMVALQEAQQIYTVRFLKGLRKKDHVYIKTILSELVTDLFCEARVGVLQGMFGIAKESIELLLLDYAGEIVKLAKTVNELDYGSAIHSVNVMAISLSFCQSMTLDKNTTRDIGLCGLLHDIGKTKVSTDILYANRRLSPDEFKLIRQHPENSKKILAEGGLPKNVQQGALEHHEKLNGHGYPGKTNELSFFGRMIGFIDCYEALTCDDRPYRRKLDPYAALHIIKDETEQGCFDKDIFKEFVHNIKKQHA